MSSAGNDLLQAVFSALSSSEPLTAVIGADGLRDRLVAGTRLPAVILSEMTSSDYSTATEAGEAHDLILEIWSDAAGRRQALEIAAMLQGLLHDAALPLAASLLVNLRHVSTRSRREALSGLFSVTMRFRAVTEPLAGN